MTDQIIPWDRLPAELRAGTKLDWRGGNCEEIIAPEPLHPQRLMAHGVLDQRQRVYQTGGEFRNFYFRKEGALTVDGDVWEQVKDRCEWVEIIDNELNHCWRIRTPVAEREGHWYDAGIGRRWGVPLNFWARSGGPVEQPRPTPLPRETSGQGRLAL